MTLERYDYLRDCELSVAVAEIEKNKSDVTISQ